VDGPKVIFSFPVGHGDVVVIGFCPIISGDEGMNKW